MNLIKQYKQHIKERDELNIPPLALNKEQTIELVDILSSNNVNNYACSLKVLM